MRTVSKNHLLFILFVSLSIATRAQDKKKEFSLTTGLVANHGELGAPEEELAYGAHLGFNLYSKKPKRLKSDLQLSMNFSGESNTSSTLFSLNGLYGGRYYILAPEKSTTAFVNALIGGSFVQESGDDFTEVLLNIGYAVGGFVVINRWILGVSAESYNNFILKIGYTF